VCALVTQANPDWSPAQIKNYLELNATDLGELGKDNVYGAGLVQLPFLNSFSGCQKNLSHGWNLICLCREPDDNSIDNILSEIKDNVLTVWKWKNNKWAVYIPSFTQEQVTAYIESKGFAEMTEITSGEGFWVNSSTNQSLTVSGTQPFDTSCSLTSGWNLIGLKSNETKLITTLISGNQAKIASVWKWEGGKWAVYLPGEDDGGAAYAGSKGFTVIGEIKPGEGFWVNCLQAVELQ